MLGARADNSRSPARGFFRCFLHLQYSILKLTVKFHDYTIADGRIHNSRLQDITSLDKTALAICRDVLKTLQGGALKASPSGRDFGADTSLGLPDALLATDLSDQLRDAMRAPGRFFCVTQRGAPAPFQVNLVLPRPTELSLSEVADHEEFGADARAIGTLLALSASATGLGKPSMEDYETLWNARPFLATAVLPFCLDMNMGQIAADYSTCFAAAMLQGLKS